ncbi:MAG: XRE family transcriptional regulator [Thermoguttaceae bacterium]|nr:XRE family transcriptional regulator [Thermoguttaceae bacterium]MBQ6619234.1 XRE family transcriptional regulator [Thermoguttaceae bacterium]
MNPFNPRLLRLVREQRGCSQTVVADYLGVRQAAYSKYESGAVTPSQDAQKQLAALFGYIPSFFTQKIDTFPSGLIYHRKRSALSSKERAKIEAEARLRMIDIQKMAQQQKLHSNLPDLSNVSPKEAAAKLRAQWNIPRGPIANMVETLENNGIVVLAFDFGTDLLDGFFVRLDTSSICIVLNSNEAFSPDRNRFTLAHELGHVLLHRDVMPDKKTEREADEFASEFLLPTEDIAPELRQAALTFARLKELKKKWMVSIAAIVFKAHRTQCMTTFAYRRFWTFMSSSGYRKNEPPCDLERETPALLRRMVVAQSKLTPDLPKFFHLTRERYEERYRLT